MEKEEIQDRKAAAALAEALGNLPLALEQAAAYATRAGISLADYLELFRARRPEVEARLTGAEEYPSALAATFDISFERLQTESPAAAELLTLCAFLAPDEVPLEILKDGAEHLPSALAASVIDPEALAALAASLQTYALAKVRGSSFLTLHHFVQAAARDRLNKVDGKNWASTAVCLMAAAFPFDKNDLQTWEGSARLLQHAMITADRASALQVSRESTAELLNYVGLYLLNKAELIKSKAAFEQTLEIYTAIFGPDHSNVATVLNNLGSVLESLGDLKGAHASFERALRIDEAAHGPDHVEVATDLNNLGIVLRELGDLEISRARHERALSIDEAIYGSEHPAVATDLNNLGIVLRELGDLEGARALHERALAILEVAYGSDHPAVAADLSNLGVVLADLGDLEGARANYERALHIDQDVYGPDHPHVATDLSNLGNVLQELGDLNGARKNLERVLAIDEVVYGHGHPEVALDLYNFACIVEAQGDFEGARAKFERALRIFNEVLGEKHPSTLQAKQALEDIDAQGEKDDGV